MADFFGRRLGREAVERIVDPLIAGIYSGDPDKLSIYSLFPRFPQMVSKRRSILLALLRAPQSTRADGRSLPVFCSLKEGLSQLVSRIVERLQATTVHTSTSVDAVRESEKGYELRTPQGVRGGYDAVILAVPAWVVARLLRELVPDTAEKMETIRYVSSATVFFAYRRADLNERLRGYGFLVPNCEGRRINGATWITNKFEHRSPEDGFLVRCFIGGDRTASQLEADNHELVRICQQELREIAGITAKPVHSRVYRWRVSGPQYDVGHARLAAEIDSALERFPGLDLTGAGFRGIGIPDCVGDGRETARRVLNSLAT
jgi:oxygen-dependent protoporphyrinogen oxidase